MRIRRGFALILVVGVLCVLAVLGSAFTVLSRLERKAALQRVHATRAVLLARSGMEDALARVSAGQDPSIPEGAYRGEDWDDDGAVTGLEAASEVYRPGKADLANCPVRHAMRPSFFKRSLTDTDANGRKAPVRIFVGGRSRGYSGQLGDATHLTWALKVEDESGKINVNGGWSQLSRVLGNLRFGVSGLPATFGSDILNRRPPDGYRTIEAVQTAVGCTTDLSPYLTTFSWQDRKVIRPNAVGTSAATLGLFGQKTTRSPLVLETGGRPPVNLNSAPRAVLYALLRDVSGRDCQPNARTVSVNMVAGFSADVIVTNIINFREGKDPGGFFAAAGLTPRPFTTWSEFRAFLYSLVRSGGGIWGCGTTSANGGTLDGVDLILANFCPETDLNKQVPDEILFRWVDKSDLLTWSTEGCFFPTGAFRISAVGRMLDSQGRLMAERSLGMAAEDFTLLRQTSQKDFVGGRTQPQDYLSLADAAYLEPTQGATAPLAPSWKTWPEPRGLGVMTYPCPPTAVAAGRALETDGQIGLATVEMAALDPPAAGVSAPYPKLLFLHHFDDGWNADFSLGQAGIPSDPARHTPGPPLQTVPASDAQLQSDVSLSVWPALGTEPNTLYPDGAHLMKGHAPGFSAEANLPPAYLNGDGYPVNHLALGYWVKANAAMVQGPVAVHLTLTRHGIVGGGLMTQAFKIGHGTVSAYQGAWGLIFENAVVDLFGGDDGHEIVRACVLKPSNKMWLPNLRWQFATAFMDSSRSRGTGLDEDYPLHGVLQEALAAVPQDTAGAGGNYPTLDLSAAENLLEPGLLFAIGPHGTQSLDGNANGYNFADDVVDEFASYDFGIDTPAAHLSCESWANRRYLDGRYYKGEDGHFTSGAVEPVPGGRARLIRAYWTAWLPQDPFLEIELSNGSNNANGKAKLPDTRMHASVAVSLVKEDGDLLPLVQGGSIGASRSSFQYRVDLRTGIAPADALNTPALETPFFDEITFVYQRDLGPRILSWDRP